MLSEELIRILTCPGCHNHVQLREDGTGLVCRACNLVYEIKNDIPIMLLDNAQALTPSVSQVVEIE